MSEESVTTGTESTNTPSAPSAPSSMPAPGNTMSSGLEAALSNQAPTPAWSPDWQYDFQGQKKEVDEFFRPLAKDEEALKKVKDYLQRADAVDMHKSASKRYQEQISEYEPTVKTVERLRDWFEAGNHDRVLSELGYTDDMLFQIAKQKLDMAKADPQTQSLMQQRREQELAQERLLEENSMYKSQAMEHLAKVTSWELEQELGKADVLPIQTAYDKAYGSGAFKQLVIERGSILVDRAGTHIAPSELIPQIAKEFAPFIQGQPTAGMSMQEQQQTQPIQPQSAPRPKVIPVVKGSGSPTKGGVNSLDELRKLSRSM